jgi:hypothetical protein
MTRNHPGLLVVNLTVRSTGRRLSPLKYQRHAERTTRLSVKSLFGCEYHLRCSQTGLEISYTRIALSEGLASKFRLFLDFNFIPRYEHSHDGYSLCLEEPGRIVRTVLSRILQYLPPSSQTSAGTCKVFVTYEYNHIMNNIYSTLTERNKCVLRPVAKEPLWHEPVWFLPIPRYETP